MSRILLVLSLLGLSLGCAPSNPALVIDGVLAPTTDCTFDSTSNVFALTPSLDTAPYPALRPLGTRYLGVLRVTSRLIPLFNNRYPLRAEPNVLSLQYVEVEVMQVDGTPYDFGGLPNPFRVLTAGTIAPGTSSTGNSGVASVEIIPPIYGESLSGVSGRLLVSLRVTGTTSGGATMTSGEHVLPLDLCANCLVACDLAMMTTAELPCLIGQDRGVTVGADLCPRLP